MTENDIKLIKETLNKIVSKNLDDDIDYGKRLLSECDESLPNCPIKNNAINYMNIMEKKYCIFNVLYNFINGYTSNVSNNGIAKCKNMQRQIWIIEKVKEVKDCSDNVDKFKKLSELLKEGNNGQKF